jgi:hypothetical protein
MMWIGVTLLVIGAVVPFLMTIGVLGSTWFLNFASFGSSVTGLFFGTIGAFMRVQNREDNYKRWRDY